MWSHWNNTNMSFQQRITESNDAHNKLSVVTNPEPNQAGEGTGTWKIID